MIGDSLTRQQHAALQCMVNDMVIKIIIQIFINNTYVHSPYLLYSQYGNSSKKNFDYTKWNKGPWNKLHSMNPEYLIFNAGHWIDP